jgi:hypothetical protein
MYCETQHEIPNQVPNPVSQILRWKMVRSTEISKIVRSGLLANGSIGRNLRRSPQYLRVSAREWLKSGKSDSVRPAVWKKLYPRRSPELIKFYQKGLLFANIAALASPLPPELAVM